MQGLTPRPVAAVHAPTFSCLFPGPVDDEPVPVHRVPDLAAEESATDEAAARVRAHAFWGRR